jgi:hypothetical protein
MMRDECGTCRFWLQADTLCRRYPPTAEIIQIRNESIEVRSVFPPMSAVGWCGEYARIPGLVEIGTIGRPQ